LKKKKRRKRKTREEQQWEKKGNKDMYPEGGSFITLEFSIRIVGGLSCGPQISD
jgi:hypothetical protein